ncbi:outer membrane protein assembly factor BamB [Lacisediminimonas profundi]|uniref:outer membrane protein assembly factor BamB n=1 Tax=Lacisediminimonas profundi TaxID=2603856 RepID=UPI00124BBF1B|nr:outer membrane protein assembly factor BamB [Lacisediminimonas profundi]
MQGKLKVPAGLLMAGVAIVLAGCSTMSSLNPFASKPAPRNPPAPLAQFEQTMAVRTLWSASIGAAGDSALKPAAGAGSVYAAAADGTVARYDAASGGAVWRISAGTRLTAGVGTDGETIAVGSRDGSLLAYDNTGKLRWKAQLSSEILSAPAVGEGVVVVRSLDNRISAYEIASGKRRWTLQRTAPPLTLRAAPGIVIASGTAFVALPGGRLLALALSNGGPRWEGSIGEPRGATELERIADVSGAPVVSGREVCAVAYQGRVGCLDVANGNGRWNRPLSSTVGLAVDERFVFGVDDKSVVNAYTRDSGGSVWRNNKLQNRDLTAPVSIGRAVAVGDMEGYVHFLSREEGAFLARITSDGSPVAGMILVGDNLVVQTRGGALLALSTK